MASHIEVSSILTLAVSVLPTVVIYLTVKFIAKQFRFYRLISQLPGQPFPFSSWAMGHFRLSVVPRDASSLEKLAQHYLLHNYECRKYGLVKLWAGREPLILSVTPESAGCALENDQLVSKKRSKWQKLVVPSLRRRAMDDFMSKIDLSAKRFIEHLNEKLAKAHNDVIDIEHSIRLATIDFAINNVIGGNFDVYSSKLRNMAFSNKTKPDKVNGYDLDLLSILTEILAKRKRDIEQLLRRGLWGEKNKMSPIDILAFHQRMLYGITDADIVREMTAILNESLTTTGSTIFNALKLITTAKGVKEQLVAEIDAILKNKNDAVTRDDIRKMHHLDCVIKETLRRWPPVALLNRTATTETEVCQQLIPEGAKVTVILPMLHKNGRHWGDIEQLGVDHFLPMNSLRRHVHSFLPFSAGAHCCPGQQAAILQVKISIASLLQNFTINSTDCQGQFKCVLR